MCCDLKHTNMAYEGLMVFGLPDLDARENAREKCCVMVFGGGSVWLEGG